MKYGKGQIQLEQYGVDENNAPTVSEEKQILHKYGFDSDLYELYWMQNKVAYVLYATEK